MSSSPDVVPPAARPSAGPAVGLLRGAAAAGAAPARLDVDLRRSRFVRDAITDGRLVDPKLERAFERVAAQVREAARAEGFAAGWAEGHAAAAAQVRAEADRAEAARAAGHARQAADVARALDGLCAAAAELERRAVVPAEQLRDAAVDAALDIAGAILDRELAVAESPGADAVRRALDLLPRDRPVTVRLHPTDHAALTALPDPATVAPGRDVVLLADPAVEPGGSVADCDATRVDAQIGTALARVREVLAP